MQIKFPGLLHRMDMCTSLQEYVVLLWDPDPSIFALTISLRWYSSSARVFRRVRPWAIAAALNMSTRRPGRLLTVQRITIGDMILDA